MSLVAERLREYIRLCSTNQSRLARDSGVSRFTIYRILGGQHFNCEMLTILKLAKGLGVNPKRLCGWEEVAPNYEDFVLATVREYRDRKAIRTR